jgi:hypothetical protein
MKSANVSILVVLASALAAPAIAQDLMIFPNNGQSQDQQNQDRGACHVWAVDNSGFDPAASPGAPPSSGQASQGGVGRGAMRGAAGGAVVGAIAGNAGRGAAMGAAGGGMMGGMRRNDQRRDQQAADQQWSNQQRAGRDSYNRALSACLEGKGYTVR